MSVKNQIPYLNTIEALADAVAADLSDPKRNIMPADRVVYGGGKPAQNLTPPYVTFELAPQFSIEEPGAEKPQHPLMYMGHALPNGDQQIARVLFTISPRAIVTTYARVPEEGLPTGTEQRGKTPAKLAERAGMQLFARVLAAIWRATQGSKKAVFSAEVLKPQGSEFLYGSAIRIIIGISSHIPDDAETINMADGSGTQLEGDEQTSTFPIDTEDDP